MWKLLPIVIGGLVLALISENYSQCTIDKYGNRIYVVKERFFATVMTISLILFVGLRQHYNDTATYRDTYTHTSATFVWSEIIHTSLGNNPAYVFVRRLFRTFGVSTETYLLFYAAVTIGISVWFLRKYSNNFLESMFLFFVAGFFTFTMAAMKQTMAIALCLLAVDAALEHKWGRFILYVVIGSLFHPYALMYFVVPFSMYRPWGTKTYCLLIAFIIAGTGLHSYLETLVNVTTFFGESYRTGTFSGEGVNPFRFLVISVPMMLSWLFRQNESQENKRTTNLFINLSILNAAIMFFALFGTANYFGRLANYFLIFQTLSIPYLMEKWEGRDKRIVTAAMIVLYSIYFYYQNGVATPFDNAYEGISLIQYLRSL